MHHNMPCKQTIQAFQMREKSRSNFRRVILIKDWKKKKQKANFTMKSAAHTQHRPSHDHVDSW